MENHSGLLASFAAIFKKATGRDISMTPANDKGRPCIAWIVSDDDLPGAMGGVEWLTSEVATQRPAVLLEPVHTPA